MRTMFINCTIFDQDISGWDTSNVTTLGFIFSGALAFDQDLSTWDISSCIEMTSFADNSAVWTAANYDAMLIAFDALALQSAIGTWTMGLTKYTATTIITSVPTTATANKLIDTGQTFITSGVLVGDIIHNVTTKKYAKVTNLDSETQLSINVDIMLNTTDTYNIETSTAAKAKENIINSDLWLITDGGAI